MSDSVLIVDDNQDMLDSLAFLLRSEGIVCHLAGTGREAIATAVAEQPTVVLLDIGLPDMSGYEVATRLKKTGKSILVAMTGFGSQDDKKRSHDAGFTFHMTKPVDPEKLIRFLRGMLAEWKQG